MHICPNMKFCIMPYRVSHVMGYFDLYTSFCCRSSSFMRISRASALAALFAASLASALGWKGGRGANKNREREIRKRRSEIAADLVQLTHIHASINVQHTCEQSSSSLTELLWELCDTLLGNRNKNSHTAED